MPGGTIAFEHEDAGAEHDGHVRDIENTGPQWTNPNIHEVDHHSIRDPIQEVGGTTRDEDRHADERPSGPATPHGDDGHGKQEQPVPDTEDRCSDRERPVRTQTEERASVFDVLQPKGVGQE
jgi:hypothetical protein